MQADTKVLGEEKVPWINLLNFSGTEQGCTNPERLVTRETKLYRMASNIVCIITAAYFLYTRKV
jgi:hypothetical protein